MFCFDGLSFSNNKHWSAVCCNAELSLFYRAKYCVCLVSGSKYATEGKEFLRILIELILILKSLITIIQCVFLNVKHPSLVG